MIAALLFSSALALTFDDLPGTSFPVPDRCNAAAVRSWNEKILHTMHEHHAPAIGFVLSGHCVGADLAPILDHRWSVGKGMPIVWEPDAEIPKWMSSVTAPLDVGEGCQRRSSGAGRRHS